MQVGRGRTLLIDSQSCENVQDLGVDVLPTVGNDTNNDLRRRSEVVRTITTLLNAQRGRDRTFFQPSLPQLEFCLAQR